MSLIQIEYADYLDRAHAHIEGARKSQERYIKAVQLQQSHKSFQLRRQIEREQDPTKRPQLQESLRQLQLEQEEFNQRIKNSSLRRRLGHNCEILSRRDNPNEHRLMPTATPSRLPDLSGAGDTSASRTKLNGLAAVYDTWTDIADCFREKIQRGAFAEAIKTSDVRALFNHNADHVFARSKGGTKTLRLYDAAVGLIFWADLLDDDPLSNALAKRIQRRDISGCSFAFTVAEDEWTLAKRFGDLDERVIVKIGKLFDVGPVTYPAYPTTSVQVVHERSESVVYDDDDDDDSDFWTPEDQRRFEASIRPISAERKLEMNTRRHQLKRLIARNKSAMDSSRMAGAL